MLHELLHRFWFSVIYGVAFTASTNTSWIPSIICDEHSIYLTALSLFANASPWLCEINVDALSPISALLHVVDLSRISSLVPTNIKDACGQYCWISGYHYNKDDAVFTWFTSLWEQYDIPQYL